MDPGQFAAMMENLVLEEGEGEDVLEIVEEEFEAVDAELECQVACKVHAEIQTSPDVFKKLIPRIWHVENKIDIEAVGGNVFVCTFGNKILKENVVESSPWIYDNAVLLFEDMSGGKRVSEMEFGVAAFWIRIHDVPPICHTEKMVAKLGNMLGDFINWDRESGKRNKSKFVRIKVSVDVRRPLRRPLRRAVKVKCGIMAPEKWARVSYERIPVFCRGCGRIGHAAADCAFVVVGDGNPFPFEEELREPLPIFRGELQNLVVGRFGGRGRGRGRGRGGWWRREILEEEKGEDRMDDEGDVRDGAAGEFVGGNSEGAGQGSAERPNGRMQGAGTRGYRTEDIGKRQVQVEGHNSAAKSLTRNLGDGSAGKKVDVEKELVGEIGEGSHGPEVEDKLKNWRVGQDDLLFGPMEIKCSVSSGSLGLNRSGGEAEMGRGERGEIQKRLAQVLGGEGRRGKEKGIVIEEGQKGNLGLKKIDCSGKGKKVIGEEDGNNVERRWMEMEIDELSKIGTVQPISDLQARELPRSNQSDVSQCGAVAEISRELDKTTTEEGKIELPLASGRNWKKRAREVIGPEATELVEEGDIAGTKGTKNQGSSNEDEAPKGKRVKVNCIEVFNGISAEAAEQSRRMQ